jgi:hypothetical protein
MRSVLECVKSGQRWGLVSVPISTVSATSQNIASLSNKRMEGILAQQVDLVKYRGHTARLQHSK